MRGDRLLVAPHDANVCGGAGAARQLVDSSDALPGRRGHEALATNGFRRHAAPGPITPGGGLIPVKARHSLDSIAEQGIGTVHPQLGASPQGGLRTRLSFRENVRLRDAMEPD